MLHVTTVECQLPTTDDVPIVKRATKNLHNIIICLMQNSENLTLLKTTQMC